MTAAGGANAFGGQADTPAGAPEATCLVQRHDSVLDLRAGQTPTPGTAPCADVFYSMPWFENLERHGTSPGDRVIALSCASLSTGTPLGCLPLRVAPEGPAAVYGPVLLGLSNFYSSLYGPVGDATPMSVATCRAVLRFLRRQGDVPGVIDLQPLDVDAPFYANWQHALTAEGYLFDSYFCFGNWYLDVAGRSFDAYFPSVPSRIRNTVKRGRKKLEDSGSWSLRIFRGPEQDLEQAIADFDSVYRSSWKVPEPFPAFVPNLIRTAAGQGWLRLGVLRVGDVPVAAQLWLVHEHRALIYKLAYDEAYKRLSAGSVLTTELFRNAIDVDRVVEIDYLTGDDGYKADWMSHRRERRGLVAFDPRTFQGAASAARQLAARQWKRWRPRRAPAAAPAPVAADAE